MTQAEIEQAMSAALDAAAEAEHKARVALDAIACVPTFSDRLEGTGATNEARWALVEAARAAGKAREVLFSALDSAPAPAVS